MSRIAFVTSSTHPHIDADDLHPARHLVAAGCEVVAAAWDDPGVDWRGFDTVVVRSTWNYHLHAGQFRGWVAALQDAEVNLWNRPRTQFWNCDKRYLLELQAAGAAVIETEWLSADRAVDLPHLLARRGWNKAVIKPAIGAGAHETFLCDALTAARDQARVMRMLAHSDVMVQPFAREVLREGELSLMFVAGEYTHCVRKLPPVNDFRVQAGRDLPHTADPGLITQARAVLAAAPEPALYARVDGIVQNGRFVLMELELIEPLMFFGFDDACARRFAAAILAATRAGPRLARKHNSLSALTSGDIQ